MTSRKKHADRSRKTYRNRMYGAQRFLRGSMPYVLRRSLWEMLTKRKPTEEPANED